MKRNLLIAALAALIAACGGGGSDIPARQAEVVKAPLLVIGNSLTFHGPSAGVGWSNGWGMAASSEDKDFAHLTAAALGLPLVVAGPRLEFTGYTDDMAAIASQDASVVVVELGDNVSSDALPQFEDSYGRLLAAVRAPLICLTTWWLDPAKDAIISAQCKAHGGRAIFIGDIYPASPDDGVRFTNPAVDAHPHDWGMARISERIVQALQ